MSYTIFSGLQWSDANLMLQGLSRTMLLAIFSTLIGTILGFLIGWARFESHVMRLLFSPYIDITRSIPLLIQFILINSAFAGFGIPLDPFQVGLLTLSLYMGVLTSELVRAGLSSVRPELIKASRSLGLNYQQSLYYLSFPLAFRTVFPGWIGTVIGLTKDTALVSVVGYIEFLRSAQILITRTNEAILLLTIVGVVYFIICYPISYYSRALERKLNHD